MENLLKLGIQIGASLSSSFKSALTTANTTLEKVTDGAKRIAETKFNTKEFTKLSRAAAENKARIDQQTSSFFAAGSAVRKFDRDSQALGKTYEKLKSQVSKVGGSVKSASVDTGALTRSGNVLGSTFQKMKTGVMGFNAKLPANRTAVAGVKDSYLALAGALYGAWQAMRKITDEVEQLERAQGELAALGVPEDGIQSITKAGDAFEALWAGIEAPEFVRASQPIIKGIKHLSAGAKAEFQTMAALTAVATGSSLDAMSNLFTRGYSRYRSEFDDFGARVFSGWRQMSAEERDIKFGEYFSAGIASVSRSFRADAQEMSQALLRMGPAASQAGMSFADQLATIGAAMNSFSGKEAATGMRAFAMNLGDAGGKLGVDVIDAATGKLRSVPDILDEIAAKYGGVDLGQEELDELAKAFGESGGPFVAELLAFKDEIRQASTDTATNLLGGLTLTEKMARQMQRGRTFQMLGQQWGNFAEALGMVFKSAADSVAKVLGQVASKLSELVENHPEIVGFIGSVVAGFFGMLALIKVFSLIGVAWTAMTTLMTANPIGLAIAGVVIGAALIIKYWEPIKGFFVRLWDSIKKIFSAAVEWLTIIWESTPLGLLFKAGKGIFSVGKSLLGSGDVGSRNPAVALPGGGSMPLASIQPASRSSVSATSVTAPITINAQPGQDGRAIAEEVQRELRKREAQAAARSRGALHD